MCVYICTYIYIYINTYIYIYIYIYMCVSRISCYFQVITGDLCMYETLTIAPFRSSGGLQGLRHDWWRCRAVDLKTHGEGRGVGVLRFKS